MRQAWRSCFSVASAEKKLPSHICNLYRAPSWQDTYPQSVLSIPNLGGCSPSRDVLSPQTSQRTSSMTSTTFCVSLV
jgi:hypothetical protein